MNKGLVWGIVIAVIVIITAFAYNSTMTGQVVSGHNVVQPGDAKQVALNNVTYTILNVEVDRTKIATFTITNEATGKSQTFVRKEMGDSTYAGDIGLTKVFVSDVVYGFSSNQESYVDVVLYS